MSGVQSSKLKVLLIVCAGITACCIVLLTGPEPLEASLPEAKPRVYISNLERSVVANSATTFGVLAPRQSLQLTTQVPGEVSWVSDDLEAGKQVAEGDLLLKIDERDYAIAVASAQARYAQAEANIQLEEGRAEIARLEWAAWQESQDRDQPANPLALRAPQRAEALARREAIAAELDSARLALERTAVRAPWPATIVGANAIVGQVLSVGEVTATLFPLDYAVVEIQVPLKTVRLLDRGVDRIELRPAHDLSMAPVVGTLEGIVKNLTEKTRLVTARIRIDDPLGQEGWAYGMHLQARLVGRHRRAVALVPADLIISGNLIWIYRDGRAQRHQLYPVEVRDQTVWVEDNFGPADALIVERPIGLFDGASVAVVEH